MDAQLRQIEFLDLKERLRASKMMSTSYYVNL
nr:hypothetical protein Iba_chr13aCG9520 [Ipomoea batatas]